MSNETPLAAEFSPTTRDDWLKLVRAALKERPFERLISKTYDRIPVEPLYQGAADATPVAARQGPWQVMSRIDHPDPATANAEALHELQNGATGLSLVFTGAIGAYGYGLPPDSDSIACALDGVYLDAIAIDLDIAEPSKHAADHVAALAQKRGLSPDQTNVRFGHDAIGAHALVGTSPLPWRELGPLFAGHVSELAKAGFKKHLTTADGRLIHNAGGSEAQELAYVVAVAVAYLRALDAANVPLDKARAMIAFRLSADADQFLTIAKFRALRLLWARVEQACGLSPEPVFIAAETAWRMMTQRDAYVNMLRTTIAVFSAGVAGADTITVLPFTTAIGLPDRFARRVARNSQLILLEEANIAKVADPAAGSGGFEALTDNLCRTAWTLFQDIEHAGGAPAALERGLIQEKVAAVRAEREAAAANRKDALTGTSDYPHLAETPAHVLGPPREAPAPGYPPAVSYAPLRPVRLAEPFERLRDASDRSQSATGARPKVFLANLGTPADFTARATFAKSFFEAGGIEAAGNDGFDGLDAMVAAFKASGARLACLCSSDTVYETQAVAAAQALAGAGADVSLAGRPGAQEQALKRAGASAFIYAGCDVVAALNDALRRIAS